MAERPSVRNGRVIHTRREASNGRAPNHAKFEGGIYPRLPEAETGDGHI